VIASSPATSRARRALGCAVALPAPIARRFEAIVFDWDGTAVPDRQADAGRVRALVEELCALGMDLAIVSGTHVGNIDGQLAARPTGPGRLLLCLNRGSEVFAGGRAGPRLVHRRTATDEEDAALTAAAELTVQRLADLGLNTAIVSQRLNRRKIDLIPEPAWADPAKARIAELLEAVERRLRARGVQSLRDAVEIARRATVDAGLPDARVTSDVKHLEIGLTDKSDSSTWVVSYLWSRGIAPDLVLIAGDEMGPLGGVSGSDSLMLVTEATGVTALSVGVEPHGVPAHVVHSRGGPAAFLRVLEDQVERRRRGDVPRVTEDSRWSLRIAGVDHQLERVHETLLCIADGRLGSNGAPLPSDPSAAPSVVLAGAYQGADSDTALVACPRWNWLSGSLSAPATLHRTLDLRTGLVHHRWDASGSTVEAVAFSSLARPATAVLRVAGASAARPEVLPLSADDRAAASPRNSDRRWVTSAAGTGAGQVVASAVTRPIGPAAVERLAVYALQSDANRAVSWLRSGRRAGFERLLVEQRMAWAKRWESADIVIEGDDALQQAVRLALYNLMGSAADEGEAAVGARGLTGEAYGGHVFWDTDVFVLPFLAATHPAAARAVLEYRVRRLPAALAAARACGRAGARFPWESAGDGSDVTPRWGSDRLGKATRIRTGELEEHIVADVAWAAACYQEWTGDTAFAIGPGLRLLVETARYWASRIDVDPDGRGHIRHVIGPDEYHEDVDDNAFTNVMARWNLRAAAAAGRTSTHAAERRRWLGIADALVDGYDQTSGLYEQFAGFQRLETLIIRDLAPQRPVAATMLLGDERVAGAQVIKQADVLMLHHMVPGEVAPDSLAANLDFYEPRTAHGSSLSPGIHAGLFARAGRLADALAALRLTARIDLDDLSGSTAGGVHLGAMGSLWQALVGGFCGVRPDGDALRVDPRLPPEWSALEVRLRFRGSVVRMRFESSKLTVWAAPPAKVIWDGSVVEVHEAGHRFDMAERES
jgi:trehalose/maltose hydrolase-like predicted phosphorylase